MWSYFKITIWAVLWLLIWIFIAPFRKKRDNCLTWAMKKYDNEGGYLVIRWCRTNRVRWIKWPHFLWMDAKHHDKLEHCIPTKNEHSEKTFPNPWFDSYIKKGDKEEDADEN